MVGLGSIAYIGKNLSERLLTIYLNKVAIFWQGLLISIYGVYALGRVRIISLVMNKGLQRKAVGGLRCLVGPSQCDGCHRESECRQAQGIYNKLRIVNGSTKEAKSQTFGFGQIAEALAEEQGIGECVLI